MIDKEWLNKVCGFKAKSYQGDTVLARRLPSSSLGDSQWIELECETNGLFLLCRWSPMYEEEMPPDRFSVKCKCHNSLLELLRAIDGTFRAEEVSKIGADLKGSDPDDPDIYGY